MNKFSFLGPLVFLGLFGLLSIGAFKEYRMAYLSSSWVAAEGVVLNSSVGENHSSSKAGGGVSVSSMEIVYEYYVDAIRYTGSRYCFSGFTSGDKGEVEALVDLYRANKVISVWHSPSDPSQATMIRGLNKQTKQMGVWLLLVLIFLFSCTFYLFRKYNGNS